jgi:hypothetical protein
VSGRSACRGVVAAEDEAFRLSPNSRKLLTINNK